MNVQLNALERNVKNYIFWKNVYLFSFQGPDNEDHHDGNFFWADITAFTIFRDPDFCYEVMPKIFEYLTDNTKLEERDIYITFNDILPHHVGCNGKIFFQ